MPRLKWETVKDCGSIPFIKASNIVNLDLIDLCEGRFWGGSKIWMDIKFSIHKRIHVKSLDDWTYQLLAPNGVHIYLHSEEEGKEIAEIIYARILGALIAKEKETPYIKLLLRNKTKHKKAKLEAMLRERKIDGQVYYSNKRPKGWMHLWRDGDPQRLGYDYAQAVELIEHGTMNFMARDSEFMKAQNES